MKYEQSKKDRIKSRLSEMARLYACYPTININEHSCHQYYKEFHDILYFHMVANGFTRDQKKFVFECYDELQKDFYKEIFNFSCEIKDILEDKDNFSSLSTDSVDK
jgi:hypothetical protein